MIRMKRWLMTGLMLVVMLVGTAMAIESSVPLDEETHHGHVSTGERIARVLRRAGLPDGVVVFLISALPIVELRGSIPVGHIFKMNPLTVYVLSVAGNMVPVPLILVFLGPISEFCMRFKLGRWFFDWLFARTRRKSADIEKYETLGLTVFVAIPLPVTGAWTGAMAAFLMGMSFRHAMVSIFMGVLIAGIIMTILSLMGWIGAIVAGIVLIGIAFSGMARWLKKEEAAAVDAGGQGPAA